MREAGPLGPASTGKSFSSKALWRVLNTIGGLDLANDGPLVFIGDRDEFAHARKLFAQCGAGEIVAKEGFLDLVLQLGVLVNPEYRLDAGYSCLL